MFFEKKLGTKKKYKIKNSCTLIFICLVSRISCLIKKKMFFIKLTTNVFERNGSNILLIPEVHGQLPLPYDMTHLPSMHTTLYKR